MKKLKKLLNILLIASVVFMLPEYLSAQEAQETIDTQKSSWVVGVTIAPIAVWDLKGFPEQLAAPLFVTTGVSLKKLYISTFYNFGWRSQGLLVSRKFSEKMSVYSISSIFLDEPRGYTGVGVGTPLGKATAFLEIGTMFGSEVEKKPLFFFGIFIPFTTSLKNW